MQTKAFLFGAGVNEKTFPQFNGFAKTLNKLKNSAAKKNNLEEAINELEDESQKNCQIIARCLQYLI